MDLGYIGKKIRECRKKRNLTQAACAGTFITRNMLSRIENGEALPSLSTLLHLADRLGVSPSFFLVEEESLPEAVVAEILPHLRKHFEKGEFSRVISLFEESGALPDNETAALLAYSYLEKARREFRSGSFLPFKESAKAVRRYLESTLFPTDAVLAELSLMEAVVENLQSPRLSLDREEYLGHAEAVLSADLYHYITEDTDFPYRNEKYRLHMEARATMEKKDYRGAIPLLLRLEEMRTDGDVSAFMLYRLYTDLELSYKELRNFERAYHYSSRRNALFIAFQS